MEDIRLTKKGGYSMDVYGLGTLAMDVLIQVDALPGEDSFCIVKSSERRRRKRYECHRAAGTAWRKMRIYRCGRR